MNYNEAKVDELTLALMYLTSFTDGESKRSWKGYDWATLDRLHAAGLISNPAKKAKSVGLSEAGAKRAEELFQKHFAK
jgi:hypothetical protein